MSDETAITIKDVMTPEVHTIDRTATVREAVRKMRDAGTSSIIVERRDEIQGVQAPLPLGHRPALVPHRGAKRIPPALRRAKPGFKAA